MHVRKNVDNRAVSPVLAVLFVLAITVAFVAIIMSGAVSLGQSAGQQAPGVEFEFDVSDLDGDNHYKVKITHNGGEAFSGDNTGEVVVMVAGGPASLDSCNCQYWSKSGGTAGVDEVQDFPVKSGDSVETGDTVQKGEVVRVIWRRDGQSEVVGEFYA